MKKISCIGVDLGASGGKAAKGSFDGDKLIIDDFIDFDNRAIETPNALYWNVFGLYNSILDVIAHYTNQCNIASIAIDTWGASYGLLDNRNRLLEPVYHYRDQRTRHSVENIYKIVDKKSVFRMTGCQCNRTYTLPQLYSYIEQGTNALTEADKLLLLPDLLSYFLSGELSTEMTIAGTSALLNTSQEDWCYELFQKLKIPTHFLTNIVDAGTVKGKLRRTVGEKTGAGNTKVIATTAHDSAAAVAAIPGFGINKLYISIGTNINMGIETKESIVSEAAFQCGFKNTGGFGRSKIVYRDFAAFWLLNELKRILETEGRSYSHADFISLAERTESKQVCFDLEEAEFSNADGDIRIKIDNYLKKTNQDSIKEDGEYVLCILESISIKIKHYADLLKNKLNIFYTGIYVVNGGSKNHLLMQMISDALGEEVRAGMPYATLTGNILTQLYAQGYVKTVDEIRELSRQSFMMKQYEPQN
ncbi:MAG: FGGY family carbohydrate kinase [Lachnospiraceae bacterium]